MASSSPGIQVAERTNRLLVTIAPSSTREPHVRADLSGGIHGDLERNNRHRSDNHEVGRSTLPRTITLDESLSPGDHLRGCLCIWTGRGQMAVCAGRGAAAAGCSGRGSMKQSPMRTDTVKNPAAITFSSAGLSTPGQESHGAGGPASTGEGQRRAPAPGRVQRWCSRR